MVSPVLFGKMNPNDMIMVMAINFEVFIYFIL